MHAPTVISMKRRLTFPLAGEAPRKADDDHMTEGVYERIKAWLLSQTLVPGQLLQIGVLAEEFGVSTTPIREALTRLAAERLVVSAPKRGFFARTPSEEEILGLYCVSQTVLDSATSRVPANSTDEHAMLDIDAPAGGASLNRRHSAARTAQLFVRIAAASGIAEFAGILRNVNDRLRHARMIECELIEDVDDELDQMIRLFEACNFAELRSALQLYHEKRLQLVPSVCKELLLKSFLSQR